MPKRGRHTGSLIPIISTFTHVQTHTHFHELSKEKKSNSTANQKHLRALWGEVTAARSSGSAGSLQVSQCFNKAHESIQDVHCSSHPSHPIKVKQQKLRMRLMFFFFRLSSLFSPQASQSELVSQPNVFIIQMATLSVVVMCHALFSTILSACKQTNAMLLWQH